MKRLRTDLIVIHAAATPPSMDIGADEIREWHKQRGWDDIGYHFVIRRDGRLEFGRDVNAMGAHARGYNKRSVGVCMVGGSDKNGKPDCNFTVAQWETLDTVVRDLLKRFPSARVIGHREVSDKACPCFDVEAWAEIYNERA